MTHEKDIQGPASTYALSVAGTTFDALCSHAAAAQEGDVDAVHDMRVTTRRLRGDLSTFHSVLPVVFDDLRPELRWLGATLGAVRDLDVQIEALTAARDAMQDERLEAMQPLLQQLQQQRQEAMETLAGALTSARYADLVATMIAALAETEAAAETAVTVEEVAADLIRRRWRKLSKAARDLDADSAPQDFHAARIRAKRLRYTLEAFAPVYGPAAERFAEEATRVQDVLGEHQDLIVLNRRLEGFAGGGPFTPAWSLLIAGELIERNRTRAREIRAAWPGLGDLEGCWRKLKRAL